jgi:hypothetical protein
MKLDIGIRYDGPPLSLHRPVRTAEELAAFADDLMAEGSSEERIIGEEMAILLRDDVPAAAVRMHWVRWGSDRSETMRILTTRSRLLLLAFAKKNLVFLHSLGAPAMRQAIKAWAAKEEEAIRGYAMAASDCLGPSEGIEEVMKTAEALAAEQGADIFRIGRQEWERSAPVRARSQTGRLSLARRGISRRT